MNNRIYTLLEKIKTEPNFQDLIKTNLSDTFKFPSHVLTNLAREYFENRSYIPNSKGLESCRKAISTLYNQEENLAENVIVTASSSESYQMIFQVMNSIFTNVATKLNFVEKNRILLPNPSYPLFEHLAKFNDLEVDYYNLSEKNDWNIDLDSIVANITSNTRFLVLISPNNPTGSFISKIEFEEICKLANEKNLILIVDEVFSIFQNEFLDNKINPTLWNENLKNYPNAKFFFLNGISKMFALPDMKLAWFLCENLDEQELEQFEIYNDTFLNANYLIQNIFDKLVVSDEVKNFQNEMVSQILEFSVHSVITNEVKRTELSPATFELLKLTGNEVIKTYNVNSGIHRIVNISGTNLSEEEYILRLLGEKHIFVHPGYFYELENKPNEVNLVMSIL